MIFLWQDLGRDGRMLAWQRDRHMGRLGSEVVSGIFLTYLG